MDDIKKKRTREQTRARVEKFRAIKKIKRQKVLTRPELQQPEQIDDENPITDSENETRRSEDMESDVGINLRNSEESPDVCNDSQNMDVHNDSNDNSIVSDDLSDVPESSDDDNKSSSSSEDFENRNKEIDDIRNWAVDYSVQQNQLDRLLCILRRKLLPDLPKSSKTFLETNKAKYTIEEMNDIQKGKGDFVYFGIREGLEACFNPAIHDGDTIEIVVNFDGMPLSKSGVRDFWPILMKIHSIPDIYEPFTVGIFSGNTKPMIEEYLYKFIFDLNEHLEGGIVVLGKKYKIVLKAIICDTPARAFIKCTQGHGGKHACERCTTVRITKELKNGVWVKIGTTVYPDTNCKKRTDKSFRNMEDKAHHNSTSPLTRINPKIDMISTIILDPMHLLFLGIMKKLFEFWLDGHHSCKLKPSLRIELGRRMEFISRQICSEFQRQPRSTQHFHKWKATEFRFFLLYCGPVVLQGLLDEKYYNHFLILHTACRILHSEELCMKYKIHAKKYLKTFFTGLKKLYGIQSLTINAHNLIHLVDDVENMQCNLNYLTSFPFENLLGKIKRRLLRTPYRPLAQVCRRMHEENRRNKCKIKVLPPTLEILKTRQAEITEVKYKGCIISAQSPNNVVLLQGKTIFQIEKIENSNGDEDLQLTGRVWKKQESFFQNPTDSASLFMFRLRSCPSRNTQNFPLSSMTKKMIMFKMNKKINEPEKIYVMPLLHV